MSKVMVFGMVGALLVALIGGTGYILARPAEAEAERGRSETSNEVAGGWGQGRGNSSRQQMLEPGREDNTVGQRAEGETLGRGRLEAGSAAAEPRGSGAQGRAIEGQGVGSESVSSEAWVELTGTVIEAGNELVVETAQGEIVVGLGQASFREAAGFEVQVGDQVTVRGYDEDGEFKAGTVDNLTAGTSITLRDSTGRPMWAGNGNNRNQP